MAERLSAAQIRQILGLELHPTCGFTCVTHVSSGTVAAEALPAAYRESHPFASGMYFLVTSESTIGLHALRSDQIYHHHLGDPLEVLLLDPDGTCQVRTVGPDLLAGERPQLVIPGGTYHISRVKSRVKGGGAYSLLSTVEFPGFTPEDLEVVDPEELCARYPDAAERIREFTS
ncbi:MAG: cupin domain-containing protein [Actinomycetia bacterium]|nr:cupin domain-containing protein [Actinomycetes bacterium]